MIGPSAARRPDANGVTMPSETSLHVRHRRELARTVAAVRAWMGDGTLPHHLGQMLLGDLLGHEAMAAQLDLAHRAGATLMRTGHPPREYDRAQPAAEPAHDRRIGDRAGHDGHEDPGRIQ